MRDCEHGQLARSCEICEEKELSKSMIGKPCLHSLKTDGCGYCEIHSQLAAAKAEIEILLKRFTERTSLIPDLQAENQRLRETIQRNEDKSVEYERLREALKDIENLNNDDYWPLGTIQKAAELARSALDGGKP